MHLDLLEKPKREMLDLFIWKYNSLIDEGGK